MPFLNDQKVVGRKIPYKLTLEGNHIQLFLWEDHVSVNLLHYLPMSRNTGSGESMTMLKRQTVDIQDIYVPVKRRQTMDPKKVEALAESILAKGQEAPVVVRADGNRFALVEGLHWLEACRALGEKTVLIYLVQPRPH
jgi:sulfiredoxin